MRFAKCLGGLVLTTAVLGAVAACGTAGGGGTGGGPAPSAGGDRLESVWTFDGGATELDPAPEGVDPSLSADEAVADFQDSDAYTAFYGEQAEPSVQFALFTDSALGVTETSGPEYTGVPVWVITYRGIPVAPGGGVEEGSPSGDDESEITDSITLVDDGSGQVILQLLDEPTVSPPPS